MAAGGKIKKTKVYAGSGNSGQRVEKQTRKAGVDQWEEKTAKEKRQYVMPQSAPALQPQPTKQTTPTVPQGPVTKAKDDQTRALVNGTVRAAPQGAITKSQADAAIEVLLAPTRKNAFPSAGLNTQRGVTDRFLKQPSGTERADAFIKVLGGAVGDLMTAGDAAVNMAGAGARERMAAPEEAASRSKALQEAARKAALAGNTQALQAVQKQQEADMRTMGRGNLLDSLLGELGTDSENDVSRILRQQRDEAIETLTRGLTPGESTLANIGLQGANMLVNQAVAAVMGLPLPVYNAITQGGAAGQEALDQGYSPEQAAGLAAGSGTISYGIEKMGGVAGDWGDTLLKKAAGTKVGQALLSKVPQKVMDFLGSVSKNKAAQVLGTGLEEGFENFTEYDLQRLWRNLMLDESTPYDIRQAMSEAASGVLFGSVMAGVPALSDAARTKYGDWQEGRAWKQDDWGRLLEEASRSENPAVRQDAADIVSRMSQGKDPSAADLGALARRGRASGVLDEDAGLFQGVKPKGTAAERLAEQLALGAAKKGPSTEEGPKVQPGMTDADRVRALRDTDLSVPAARPERLEGVDLGELETAIKSRARQYIRPLAEKLGVFKDYQNDNVNLEFSYTKGSFDESIHKQKDRGGRYDDFAKMFSVFDELVQNAVPIEFHGDKYAGTSRAVSDLNRVAVLVSAFQDGKRVVPVQFEIKEFNNQPNRLYVSVTLRDIKTEPRVMGDTLSVSSSKKSPIRSSVEEAGVVGGGSNLAGSTAPPIPVPNYSITRLFQGVNPEDTDFLKYVPDAFLSPEQQAGKQAGLQAEQEKIGKMRRESSPAADAETEAVETLLNVSKPGISKEDAEILLRPMQENEAARKRFVEKLAQQIIVNKDGWTQADLEEARRIRGGNRETDPSHVRLAESDPLLERIREESVSGHPDTANSKNAPDPTSETRTGEARPEGPALPESSDDTSVPRNGGDGKGENEGPRVLTSQAPAEAKLGRETLDQMKTLFRAAADARTRLERAKEAQKLNDKENSAAESIARGYSTLDQYPADIDFDLDKVQAMAEALRSFYEAEKPVKEFAAQQREARMDEAMALVQNLGEIKPKKLGISYELDTPERVFRDVFQNPEVAEKMINTYLWNTHENEARKIKKVNEWFEKIRRLNLTAKEFEWVQKIGDTESEGHVGIERLPAGMDKEKIKKGDAVYRSIYDEILSLANDAQIAAGKTPTAPRKDYYPHFLRSDKVWVRMLEKAGFRVQSEELPTWLQGITEFTEPNMQWSKNLEHRTTNKTDYDALEGFKGYIGPVANIIFHTEDAMKLRALDDALIFQSVPENTRKQIQDIRSNDNLTLEEQSTRIENLITSASPELGAFHTWLHNYTNVLNGKKSVHDRGKESDFGRKMYTLTNTAESIIAKNAVAANVSVALSNFGALAQGAPEVSKKNLAQAMWETARRQNDISDYSAFVTNRGGIDEAYSSRFLKNKAAAENWMANTVDQYVTKSLVKARYLDNVDKGMSGTEAIKEADQWAAGVMGDRSKGAKPMIFERRNPVTKVLTMFQLESNNQIRHLLKDMPSEAKKMTWSKALSMYMQYFVYSYAFDAMREMLGMSDFMINPIGIAKKAIEDFTDPELSTAQAMTNTAQEVLDRIPFNTLISNNGRYFTDAAIPKIETAATAAADLLDGTSAPNYAAEKAVNELLKPIYYLNPWVPGGQLKKTLEGSQAFLEGGVYQTQRNGGESLLFPIEQNTGNLLQALTLGAYASPNAKEYFRYRNPVEPQTQEQKNEAKARSLPRLLNYSYGEDENRVEGSVMLNGKEQKAYQDAFAALLPENMESLSPEMQKQIYQYAEQIARDSALAGRGVEEYSPASWVQKAQEAAEAGIGVDNFLKLKEQLSALEPIKDPNGKTTETAAQQKRNALFENEELTPEQKQAIDLLLISGGDSEKVSDYTNSNAYLRSQMNETEQARYDAAAGIFSGMTAEEYQELAKLAKSQKAGEETGTEKKQAVLQALMDRGMNRREAYAFYALAKASNPGETNWTDVEGACYAGLSDSGKTKYQAVREYFVELPVSDFAYIQDILSGVEGDRDQSGKTVSGSLKRNKLAVLMGLGMTAAEAQVYYNLTK